MEKVDIAVVGAGPAGGTAAYVAAMNGASVMLIDEQSAPGGHLRWTLTTQAGPPDEIDGKRGFEIARQGAGLLADMNVRLELSACVWGLFENNVLGIARDDEAFQIQAETIILAPGSTDIVWPFRGWTLPGVITARAARIYMHLHRVLPGERFIIIGSGTDADELAEEIEMAGAEVAGRATSPDQVEAGGDREVEWVSIDGERVAADSIVLALGVLPDPELARHALVDIVYDDRAGCHVPARSETLETTVPGIYAIGEVCGPCTTAEATAEGMLAGQAAVGADNVADLIANLERVRSSSNGQVGTPPNPDPTLIPDDVLVDREEGVTAGQIREAISEGAVSLNDVKRRTRAGMGMSQGRDTEYVIARMITAQTGIPLAELVPMTARPPARPIPLAALASLASRTD